MLKLGGRKLVIQGVAYDVEVEEFRTGDAEAFAFGYIEGEARRIVVDANHQDDATLAHEVGHAVADQLKVYLSEYQVPVFELLFAMCRDPRNAWFLKYLAGA